jgi:hypothetical protein
MGKVDDAHYAKDEAETKGHDGICRPNGDSIHKLLQELTHSPIAR